MEEFVKKSIDRLKLANEMSLTHYKRPLVLEYSGGKDSDILLWLFEQSGIPFDAHHSLTTVDAPPTVYHIKKTFRRLELKGIKCQINYHKTDNGVLTMWNLIPSKLMPPTRAVRYCCSDLKECGDANRMIATGIRWAESAKRKKRSPFEVLAKKASESIGVSEEKMLITDNDDTRRLFENCRMKAKTVVNPIIEWTDLNIWDVIQSENIPVCEMYDWGYERIGCIGCPLAKKCQREREFYDFPKYKEAYIRAFDHMLDMRRQKKKPTQWTCGEEVFQWWMQSKDTIGQIDLFDYFKEKEIAL